MKRHLLITMLLLLSAGGLSAQDTPPADDIEFMGLSMKETAVTDLEYRLMNKGFKMLTDNRDSVRFFEGLLDGDTVAVRILVNPYSIYYADALYFICEARQIDIVYIPDDSLKARNWHDRYRAAFDKKYASYRKEECMEDTIGYANPAGNGVVGLIYDGTVPIATITYMFNHEKPEPDRLGLEDL